MTKFRRPIEEILSELRKPIPPELLKTKPTYTKGRKAGDVLYVPWYVLIQLLDDIAPGFDWEVRSKAVGQQVVIEGSLTIKAAEGDFIREATGQEESEVEGFGDPTSNAEAMALRRCCAKFGLGLHLRSQSGNRSPATTTTQGVVVNYAPALPVSPQRQKLLDRIQEYFTLDRHYVQKQAVALFGRVIPRREMTDEQLFQLVSRLDSQSGVVEGA
jgi:hypothetical protein